jgi:hypothetical protein
MCDNFVQSINNFAYMVGMEQAEALRAQLQSAVHECERHVAESTSLGKSLMQRASELKPMPGQYLGMVGVSAGILALQIAARWLRILPNVFGTGALSLFSVAFSDFAMAPVASVGFTVVAVIAAVASVKTDVALTASALVQRLNEENLRDTMTLRAAFENAHTLFEFALSMQQRLNRARGEVGTGDEGMRHAAVRSVALENDIGDLLQTRLVATEQLSEILKTAFDQQRQAEAKVLELKHRLEKSAVF